MSKLYSYFLALLILSKLAIGQGQPGEEGPPYYGLELPPYGSGRNVIEAFEKEIEKRKRAHPGFIPPPYEKALEVLHHGPNFHQGVILSYDKQSIKELKRLLLEEEAKYRYNQKSAIHALGIVHSVDPGALSFDALKSLIVEIEQSESISAGHKVGLLASGYMGLSYSKNPQAYDFLIERVTGKLWAGGEIPKTGRYVNGSDPSKAYTVTAQSKAIRAISGINDSRIPAVLKKLRDETSYDNDHIHDAIPSGYYSKLDQRYEKLREEAYAKRLASLEINKPIEESNSESDTANPTELSEAAEAVKEATPPKPTTAKPAEVKTPDTSEEPTEQSSIWWLWLIVAVVVASGIALAVRRKS